VNFFAASRQDRLVTPERLDQLAPEDPLANGSRRDLRRVHRAMGTATILRGSLQRLGLPRMPRRVLELGAGDGSLMLRVARASRPLWRDVELTLLDRVDVVDPQVRDGFRRLHWQVEVECVDVLDWANDATAPRYDLCTTTLFLHHFDAATLATLLAAIAARADAFLACEPRRCRLAQAGSRLVGLLGSNAVTRGDAVRSVAAGFAGRELTTAWTTALRGRSAMGEWATAEYAAGPFSQVFTAIRLAPPIRELADER